MTNSETRCTWCGTDPLYVGYHDREWGRPETDSRALWEKLVLDGFQAGLAWITILRKRDNFRAAFNGFEPSRIARWGEAEVVRLLADPGIVRSRAKIEATIGNARAWEEIEAREGFAQFLWQFYHHRPRQNRWETMAEVPATTAESREMAKALKAAGFKFCGPTIVYAFAQACGMVNDHIVACPQHAECEAEAARVKI
ncbi:MAG TPA: DNA-3-methyladenine glycosylase I [Paracoccaceae bacterium]|nr:DNA-3-methyladenine glycosylase I [Paracoccaceae bacterium]